MPYYHVYVKTDLDEETEETDFSKDKLIENIVKPFNQHRKFMCKGTILCPNDIAAIRIIETEQSSKEIFDRTRVKRGILGLLTNDFSLLEESGRDVTRDFVEISQERRRKRVVGKKPHPCGKDVFIVHGTNHKPMEELKALLKSLGLNPIVLHEKPSGSMTVVEKLEEYSNVGYVFVILTPDDMGGPFKGKVPVLGVNLLEDTEKRARQNVILELGYFMGKLGRDKICCLYLGDMELPSDIHGIVYVRLKDSVNEAKDKIVKELRAAGYEINDERKA